MTADPEPGGSTNPFRIPLVVEQYYSALICHALVVEAGLGGRLLYVGELDADGRALMAAGNIAGAASLAVSADVAAQKQAIHEGVADFLVNSLDEAMRILKNEVRKREAVAVCAAAAPGLVEREMLERGVRPDLVRELPGPFGGGLAVVEMVGLAQGESLLKWSVDEAPAHWLPRLDAMALESLGSEASRSTQRARRWLRLGPRYLGRLARNVRVLRCGSVAAEAIADRMRAGVLSGEIAVPVRIELN